MSVLGIDEITFGAADLAACRRFFLDWGLKLAAEADDRLAFETLNGCRVIVARSDAPGVPPGVEPDPTLREVVWGVRNQADLRAIAGRMAGQPGCARSAERVGCIDPNGLSVQVQVSRKRVLQLPSARTNTWSEQPRVDSPAPSYERATPIEVGHAVFFVKDLARTTDFYREVLGFVVSDRYPDRGNFMRCAAEGGHHDLFLLQLDAPRAGLNHVAFSVRDIHEVFGGGMHMARQGWSTELGPGRHPISSAIFWYFHNPAGALVEYYTDEDQLTAAWQPRDFTPGPTVFAEWAIQGGIDGHTRRQQSAPPPPNRFMTDNTPAATARHPSPTEDSTT
jgi:catechol 2,3-dioxygenase-like lactoylglutathione lyase family enzyme